MLDSVATMKQPAPTGDGADVTGLVVADLLDRRAAGTAKYGTPLLTNNGRDALVDAYQEACDLTVYLRQKIEEEQQRLLKGPPVTLKDDVTVRLVQSTGGDYMVVAAAKVSTSGGAAFEFADPAHAEGNAGLINYLMKHRHGTPFEHASLTLFVHAPIFVWREWHRHRIGFSYNEESARYKQLAPVFWVPPADRKLIPVADPGDTCKQPVTRSGPNPEMHPCGGRLFVRDANVKYCPTCGHEVRYHTPARPTFQAASEIELTAVRSALADSYGRSYATYQRLIDAGIAKEVARACLPVGIYSSCWVTCNPRSLMSFLSLRTHEPAATFVSYPQAEIEQAARAAEQVLKEGWPMTHAAFVANGRVGP